MGPAGQAALWSPSPDRPTAMRDFMALAESRFGIQCGGSYQRLWEWSVGPRMVDFWSLAFEFLGIQASSPATQVLDASVPMGQFPAWFPGCRLNYAQNLLRAGGAPDAALALVMTREDGQEERVTFGQLRQRVAAWAAAFRRHGIQPEDRIAAYVPNCPEAIIGMLAASACGAIWSSASCDFGASGVVDRFSQIAPRLLLSVNGVVYNGRVHEHLGKLREAVAGLPSVEQVVVFPFVQGVPLMPEPGSVCGAVSLADFLGPDAQSVEARSLVFEQLPFDHPLVILFSSGTTGKPKCIVHGAGRLLIQHLKEHVLHGDLGRKDVFFYYTTTSWMMWNWLAGALATGATVVLYDGSPFKPSPNVLWELVDRLGITVFGTSAKYLQSLQEGGILPGKAFQLTTLRSILSTGSPLAPATFDYVYRDIKADLVLGSITGGTDIASLFAGHNEVLPVYRGEIQCKCLGMAVEAWNEAGQPVLDAPGNLVCVKPFPAMPVCFWGDVGNVKYTAAYFGHYPNVWYHGDFVQFNSSTGGLVMLGRSDGTLNPSGVRFGSADLYNITITCPEILDSLAVGQKQAEDERVVLFLKMCQGQVLTPELVARLKSLIRTQLSPRHVPAFILSVADIPYTLTGKKVEVAVKQIISGETPKVQASTLANPESLALYYGIPELQ